VSFAVITFCVASQRVFVFVVDFYKLSPETFGYTLVHGVRYLWTLYTEIYLRIV